jgi:hypothetical protein
MRSWKFLLISALVLGLAVGLSAAWAEDGASQTQGGAGSQQDMGGAGAQQEQGAPGAQQDPGAAGAQQGQGAAPGQTKEVEGEISSIDAQNQTLRVGGFAGLFGTSLQVTDQTKFVPSQGAEAVDFNSLKEGDRIRASYQMVGDRNVANEIEVISPKAGAAPAPGSEKQAPGAAPGAGAGGGGMEGGAGSSEQQQQPPSGGSSGPSY